MLKEKYSEISFEGKDFLVGIDQGKRSWVISIQSSDIILETISMDPAPKTVYGYMSRKYSGGTYHIVYEARYWGFWAQREFERLGCTCMVVNPADVPETNKERNRRTDRVDSRKLVRELSNGSLDALYIPSQESENFRVLVRYLVWCPHQEGRIKTRIKSVLAFLGVTVYDDYPEEWSRHWSGNYIKWLESLELDSGPARDCLLYYIQELREHRSRKASILKNLRTICKRSERMELIQLLCSIPGIGFYTASVLQAELIDMHRFSKMNKLKAYAGLILAGEQSSETRKEKGVHWNVNGL